MKNTGLTTKEQGQLQLIRKHDLTIEDIINLKKINGNKALEPVKF